MQFGDFLNTLATKLGLQNDQALVDLLANAQLAQTEIADDFAQKMNTGLMSLEGAKSRTDLENHFKAQALNAADARIAAIAKKYGAETEFAGVRSTYDKIDHLESYLAAKIAAAEAAGGKTADIKKYEKDLQDLQAQLSRVTADKDKEIATLRAQQEQEILNMLVNAELRGKRYANADVDADTNAEFARVLLNRALQERGAKLVNEGGKIAIKRADNTALAVLDEGNNPLQFSAFTDKLLADKHLLEVSDPGNGHIATPPTPPTVVTTTGGKDTSKFDSAIAQSLADLS